MRDQLSKLPRPFLAGLLVFLMAFGLFGATTQQLTGYEPETGAVTEGLVLHGHFWGAEDPALPLLRADILGRGGHRYARTGLPQPLLEAPFFAAGNFIDSHFGPADNQPFRQAFLWFYNPFIAAIAAVAIFALVFMARRSIGWATAIAALFVVASIAWPYSKIGMETTYMAAVLVAFALAVWARRKPTVIAWGLTGFASGAAAATKPYALVALVAIAVLLWPTFMTFDRRRRVELALAICLPVLAWFAAIAWYNWVRFGSPTNFGYQESSLTLSMPLNALGLLFSPGKGLIFYSPLVVLGALGLPRLWREDRALTAALLVLLAGLTCIAGASSYWGDEVWGPRYIVPAAWTLLVPIAWWADSRIRRKVLVGVAMLAFAGQVVAVSVQYARYVPIVQKLTGVPVYGTRVGISSERIPYGDDPTRWIPELSPLLLQTESLISSQIISRFGGDGLHVTYDPFEGRSRTLNLSDPSLHPEVDFWWNGPFSTLGTHVAALLMFLISVTSGLTLYLLSTGRTLRRHIRVTAPG
jgi:hypothetical protein